MRFGVQVPPFADPGSMVEVAVEAEAAGWDAVFLWDHVVWERARRLDVHDPWVVLGAMATRTERVGLGTLVTPLARRRPWIVARQLISLDHLSHGRAILGVGLGAPAGDDFADFGDPGEPRVRGAILDEAVTLLDGLLRGPVVHDGEHFTVTTDLLPRPVQQPRPPIWVAAEAPHRRPLRRAAQWDGIVPLSTGGALTPDGLAAYLDGVDQPPGWEVVVIGAAGVAPGEYADAGATWYIEGAWPEGDWLEDLRARVRAGPSGR